MLESTFISKFKFVFVVCFFFTTLVGITYAAEDNKVNQPEESDFSGTPYTQFGEFNESEEEDSLTKFFQYGRFFGVSLGGGFQGVTGNRGVVYQSGFPMIDFKVHYWFDFNFALNLGFSTVNHFYVLSGATTDVNMVRAGVDLKYYIDVKNLSAAITFMNPFISLGVAGFNKTESSTSGGTVEPDSALGVNVGAGLEIAVKPRYVYINVEGKYHFVRFRDTFDSSFNSAFGVSDLTGGFYTATVGVLFTW
jgi:hypothetical protein